MYYVTDTGQANTLAIVKLDGGVRINTIRIQGGELDSTPVIMGDRCSFIIKKGIVRTGLIYKIPQGTFITDFRVG